MRKTVHIVLAASALCLPICAQHPKSSDVDPLVFVQDGRYGFIDHSGKTVISAKFLWADDFNNGYAPAYVCGRMVWIDPAGTVLSKRSTKPNELSPEEVNGKFGFVDDSVQFRIRPIYDEALPFSDGAAAVRVHDLWGYVDTDGHEIIPPKFDDAYNFRDGVAAAVLSDDFVLIDKTGEVIASGYNLTAGNLSESRIPVGRDGKFGFLDLRGNITIPLEFDFEGSFSHGLAPVEKGAKWGYIDRDGQVKIPFIFDEAGVFASGLAAVKKGEESGFIDSSGKFAFRLAFEHAAGFLTWDDDETPASYADVSRFWTANREFGYVNRSGTVIWGPTKEMPDHTPIGGWSEEDRANSCDNIPKGMRDAVASLPQE